MCTQKMRALSYIGAEKITFPPKLDRHTDRRTDISVYRVASLLKRYVVFLVESDIKYKISRFIYRYKSVLVKLVDKDYMVQEQHYFSFHFNT